HPGHLLARHRRRAGGDRVLRHRPRPRGGAVRVPPRRALRAQRRPLHRGARVPSRQLSRFLDRQLVRVAVALGPTGKPKVDPTLLGALEDEGRALKGDEIRVAFPEMAGFVDPAIAEATRAAEVEMRSLASSAREAILAERDASVRRMRLSLQHQGLQGDAVEQQVKAEEEHYQALLDALGGLKIALDSACAFVINR